MSANVENKANKTDKDHIFILFSTFTSNRIQRIAHIV